MKTNLTNREIKDINSQQVFTLESKIHKGEFSIQSVGDYLPGNVLVTDLGKLATVYMNKSGCNILKHSVEELEQQGPEYFQQFFVHEEISMIVPAYLTLQQKQNPADIYSFVHRVKAPGEKFYKWYFAAAKLMYTPGKAVSEHVILIVNEVNTLGSIAKKINSVLDESDWMKKNFKKFCRLNKREKEIITLLVDGKNSAEIADLFHISRLTVNTHRRNINSKLEITSFAGLYKFAITFGLSGLKSSILLFLIGF